MERYEKTLIDLRSGEGIVFNRLSLSKDTTGFFITSRYPRVLSKRIKLYQGDQILSLRSFNQSFTRFDRNAPRKPRPLGRGRGELY